MKAIILNGFGSVENFEIKEVEKPVVSDNEVLVKIKATSFNPIDYQMRRGASESKLLKSPILGRELSGEIAEVGKGVANYKKGDRVAAYVGNLASNGTYTEYISIPESLLALIPANTSFEVAAALPMVGLTALQCFTRLQIPRDAPVFIAGGAGGVGTALIKLLIAEGNNLIYSTAGNSDSINHLLSLGLRNDRVINYKNDDIISRLGENNFDYVIDLVGGVMSEICAKLISIYGYYADVTFLTTDKARELLFDKAVSVVNIANYANTFSAKSNRLQFYGTSLQNLFHKVENNIITPPVIQIIGELNLDTVKQAHLLMEENLTNGRKLVMRV